jgi:Ca-activated chloride channel homolog
MSQRTNRHAFRRRRGSFIALAMFVLAAMVIVCGMCINLAYMELIRTEQRLATDAAAKAASVVLGKSQSESQARSKAVEIAALHQVAGSPLNLAPEQIIFGVCDRGANNALTFTPGPRGNLLNAVTINSNLSARDGGGAAMVMLPAMLNPDHFSPQMQAIASRVDLDVCIVADRSGSMAWDLSNVPWSYPGTLQGQSTIQNYFQLPHATLSRWAALTSSIDSFMTIVDANPFDIHVGLASYSSNFTFGVYSSTVASIDQPLTNDYGQIETKLNNLARQPLIGNTNIAAGLREGINVLTDPSTTRTTACKVLILITDGVMTQGDDPVTLATLARNSNIRVHTIAFSSQADVSLMQRIAAAGSGNAYLAPNATTLDAAFREIAATLPAMLAE